VGSHVGVAGDQTHGVVFVHTVCQLQATRSHTVWNKNRGAEGTNAGDGCRPLLGLQLPSSSSVDEEYRLTLFAKKSRRISVLFPQVPEILDNCCDRIIDRLPNGFIIDSELDWRMGLALPKSQGIAQPGAFKERNMGNPWRLPRDLIVAKGVA